MTHVEHICLRLAHITGLDVKVYKSLKRTFYLGLYLKETDPGGNEVMIGTVVVWERTSGQWEVISSPTHNLVGWLQSEIDGLKQEGVL